MAGDHTFAQLKMLALNLLARREYSHKELHQKLVQKGGNQALVEEVLADLIDRNLLSDKRFAETFLQVRIRQGKGSLLIVSELKEKGISQEIIDTLISEIDLSWVELAREARKKRFGSEQRLDYRDKAKQIRFLQSRGFMLEHIQAALTEE